VRTFNHRLSTSAIVVCAAPLLAKRLAKHFPRSLNGAPAILPVGEMTLRRQLEHWFELHNIRPRIVAEVEDTALLIDLGAQGLGFIPIYSPVFDEVKRFSRFKSVGVADGLRAEVFAITAQRRLQHPGVLAMTLKAH
jgi:LysR family transcriptional activator of nhaA